MEIKEYSRLKCPNCSKLFKYANGLKWHIYHIHEWKNEKIKPMPGIADRALDIVKGEIQLKAIAKGLNISVEELKNILDKGYYDIK